MFDLAIHAMNTVLLIPHVNSVERILLALAIDAILGLVIIFNPKFAWSNPEEVPNWVQSRIKPLSPDERQEIKSLEKMGHRLRTLSSGFSS